MKLNNKGFAITSILYGMLILFVSLTGSYLIILSAQKNRVDKIMEDFESKEGFNSYIDINASFPYMALYTGKYVFDEEECYSYIIKGTIIRADNITLASGDCTPTTIKRIYYGSDSGD